MTDPRTRLGLLACVGVLAVTLEHAGALAVITLLCALPFAFLRVDRVWAVRAVVALAALSWGTILSQGLFYGEHPRVPVLVLGPLVVWREGLLHGVVQSLRFVALTLAGLAVATSTPVDRLLAALVRLRVPYGLAFLAVTALRFVPETADALFVVRAARARRGRPLTSRPPWQWLSAELSMLRPVVARSLRRARALAESLDARGFDPFAPRTERRPLAMTSAEKVVLTVAFAVTTSAVVARVLYGLYTAEVAWFPALRPMYSVVRNWL